MASIGFIGLGMMGEAMVRRLLLGGHTVTVWNRTQHKSKTVEKDGAVIAPDLKALASGHDIVFSMISTSAVLAEIAAHVRSCAPKGAIHVDMSTVSPETARQCESASREEGRTFIHAPVLGSIPQVNDGSLLIFAGGSAPSIKRVMPFFEAMSKEVFTFPEAAHASSLKLTCNFFIASMIMTLGQGLSFASAAGLEGTVLLDVLARSALAAPMYTSKGTNILAGNFKPRFLLEHMLKDMRLFRDAADELAQQPVFTPALIEAFKKASAQGLGNEDYSSVVKVL